MALRPVEPQCRAELRVGAGQRRLVEAQLGAERRQADAPVELRQPHDARRQLGGRAHRLQRRRDPRAGGARLVEQQRIALAVELGDAGRQPRDQIGGRLAGRRDAQQVGDVAARGERHLLEQREPRGLRHRRRLDRAPQFGQAEQPLGHHEHRGDLGHADAFLLRQLDRRQDAQPVDEPVGELGRHDLAAQPVRVDRLGEALAHRGREGGVEIGGERRIGGERARLNRVLQRQLGGRQQHRQLGPGQPLALLPAAQQRFVVGQPLDLAVEPARRLERLDRADVAGHRRGPAADADPLGDRQRQRLQAVVLEHQRGDVVGHRGEQLVAIRNRQPALDHLAVERDLDVDLVVRAVDARRIVDEVGVDPAARFRERDPRRLRHAQVRALADRGDAQLLRVDAQAVVGGIADIGVRLGRGLHVGADAAEPEEVGGRLQDRGDQRRGLQAVGGDAERRLHLRRDRDRLGGAAVDAAARRHRPRVIRPGRARQREQPRALGIGGGGIGRGVEEDVAVVERRDQLDLVGQEHAVAEHVARHVAAADDGDRLGLHVHPALGEVALDGDPGALRRDPHRLVVVALRSARGEGVAQPEAALQRQRVGDVGEGRGALVGGDDEIRVLAVEHAHALGVDDPALDDVVGDRQQRADEHAVALGPLGQPRVAVDRGIGQLLRIETALGARRHDHRVLHALRLHEAEDLGAEIVAPVRPTQAAARDRPGAQVDALDARAVDPHLAPRHRRGEAGDQAAVELEGERLGGGGRVGVGAQRRADQAPIGAQDAVVVDRRDRVEPGDDRRVRRGDVAALGRVRGGEARDQRARRRRRAAQCVDHGGEAVGQPRLAQVAEPGAQQHHVARGEADLDEQPVERIVLGAPLQHRRDRAFQHRGLGVRLRRRLDDEVVDERVARVAQPRRQLADHAEAEILEHRHRVRQRQRAAQLVDLELPVLAGRPRDEPHAAPGLVERGQAQHVGGGLGGGGDVAVVLREAPCPAQRQARGAGGRHLLGERRLDLRLPAAHHPLQPLRQRPRVGHRHRRALQVEHVADQRDLPVLQRDRPVEQLRVRRLRQHRADRDAARRRHLVARQPDEREQVPAERRGGERQRRARTIGERHRGQRQLLQPLGREADHHVVRQRRQRVRQRLAVVAARIEAELRLQGAECGAQHRHLARRRGERGAGPQPRMDRQPHRLAALAQRHDDQVERHRAVDRGDEVGLEEQRRRAAAVEPVERQRLGRVRQDRPRLRVARDAERRLRAAVPAPRLVAEQRQLAVEEPAQQRRALARPERVGVGGERALQRVPVGHRGAHVGERGGQERHQLAPVARVGALHLQVDHRLARRPVADRLERAVGRAGDGDDGVDDAVDRDVLPGDRGGDRIDQEGHVVVDHGDAHPAAHVVRRHRLQRDRGLAGGPAGGGGGDEAGGVGHRGVVEIAQFAG